MDATIKYIDPKDNEKTIKVKDIRFLEPPADYCERKGIECKKVIECLIIL